MKQFLTQDALKSYLQNKGGSIGFVPTMGALHEGHLALIKAAKAQCEQVVCSIFVNPTQFNDPSDFEKYPKTLANDIKLLTETGCDIVYTPEVDDLYPSGMKNLPHYPLGRLEELLEGAHRPGHFQGVCVVVDRLLQAVQPSHLYMGQKDFQQIAIIRKMLEITKSNVNLIECPTVRESSGLAMSSRNSRLSAEQKTQALAIFQGFNSPSAAAFESALVANGFETVDYVACCDPITLENKPWDERPCQILVAAFIGGVRLIDNQFMP
ncbi:pantoate--beta-alanine ligase [Aquirufa regiilacus]|uniref:Pantothenate synthetase n=1 Tax=Aquirufa regiilacus TaxID=3024868 RepID=A0ABU3TTC8_9BACT|nr:pantoate--beta-alanine ligase [Aquirufa sp. LEOWEIH-7C]MDU0809117.1 pantoate--beta-alanine ligase [Aquirufa sp. LEOWEIH-7C]